MPVECRLPLCFLLNKGSLLPVPVPPAPSLVLLKEHCSKIVLTMRHIEKCHVEMLLVIRDILYYYTRILPSSNSILLLTLEGVLLHCIWFTKMAHSIINMTFIRF
jgi:hypothetical protein